MIKIRVGGKILNAKYRRLNAYPIKPIIVAIYDTAITCFLLSLSTVGPTRGTNNRLMIGPMTCEAAKLNDDPVLVSNIKPKAKLKD